MLAYIAFSQTSPYAPVERLSAFVFMKKIV